MSRKGRLLSAIARSFVLAAALVAAPLAGQDAAQESVPGVAGATAAEQARQSRALGEALSLIDLWIEQTRQYERIPALSVAVVRGDQTVWARGYGHIDRARRIPASADTIYSICSISKLFTAVAFMQLWEQGKVRLDEPVTTYLPWARLAPDARESLPVTMEALLTHSAGLPREAVHPYWTGPDFPFPTDEELREGISGQSPLYPVGRTFQYSNLGMTLVGDTVAVVSGVPYGEYVTDHILQPLGLANTRPFIPGDLYGRQMAVGWGSLDPDGTRPAVRRFDARGINPAAGFSSSVNDLARFARWQFRLLRSGEAEVLRASTLREMHRVHYLSPDRRTSWGLGFSSYQLDGREIVGHGGSCPGYRSTLMLDPASETAIAIALNAMEDPARLARKLTTILAQRLNAQDFAPPPGAAVKLLDYAGIYDAQPWNREFAILPWAGGLASAEIANGDRSDDPARLKPIGADRFLVVTDRGEERDVVTFLRDDKGRVTGLERFGNFTRLVRPLGPDGGERQ